MRGLTAVVRPEQSFAGCNTVGFRSRHPLLFRRVQFKAMQTARKSRNRFRSYVLHHGLAATLFHLGYRALNRAAMVMIFRVVALDGRGMKQEPATARGIWRFLSRDELDGFSSKDPSLELTRDFIALAFARGDKCYGFVQDGVLGAYAWYSTSPTPVQDSLVAHFDRSRVYMHKAVTAPAFRGQRLYGIGVERALQTLVGERTAVGLISCVQIHNHPSQKALKRIGFRTIGWTMVLGWRKPWIVFSSFGCMPSFRMLIQDGSAS
jgi:RimJ/RimL family protein N-acetyltransferase